MAPIVIINLFAGWTLLGYIVALAWSVSNESNESKESKDSKQTLMDNPSPDPEKEGYGYGYNNTVLCVESVERIKRGINV